MHAKEENRIMNSFPQLEIDGFEWVSGAGNHTCLAFRSPGLGPLHLRQFSDFQPGGPIFSPAAGIGISGREESTFQVESALWRPEEATCRGRFGPVSLRQTIVPADADLYLGEFECDNDARETIDLEIRSSWHPQAEADLRGGNERLVARLTHEPHPMWGASMFFDETFEIIVRGVGIRRTAPECWKLPLRPGRTARFRIVLARRNAQATMSATELLDDPETGRRRLGERLSRWFDEMPRLEEVLPAWRKEARFCWYWLWFDTMSPKGRWIRPGITPSRIVYGRGVWLWDSAFHVFGLAHGGPGACALGADQIPILTENMVDGHLPREVWVDTPGHDLQAPGILTQAALRLLGRNADLLDPAAVYRRLRANFDWYLRRRRDAGAGLCMWDGGDSGWDTSPRWDAGRPVAVDLNAWMIIDARNLARLARLAGLAREATSLEEIARDLAARSLSHFWHEEDGLFYDRFPDGSWRRVVTPVSFWAMYAGFATPEQARRIARRLDDPDSFGTPYPIPSVAQTDPAHVPNEYWRGPVWINLNWIAVRALQRYGLRKEAEELRTRTLDLVASDPVAWEYYRPDTGKGIGAPVYGWTAALFLDLLADPQGAIATLCD